MKRLLNFNDADPLGRCVACNGTMEKVSHKVAVRELVPTSSTIRFMIS